MKAALRPALTATLPVFFGYLFLGIAFGVLFTTAGFPAWLATVAAITMYAGSGQILLVSLLTSNASLFTCAAMTLLLNCRHIFYGLSFLEDFRKMGKSAIYMIFSLTDETYSLLCSVKTPRGVDEQALKRTIAVLDQLYWIFGSTIGAVVGAALTFDTTGIDFAMTALFTVIFVEQWRSFKSHLPALIGVVTAVVALLIFGPDRFILPAMLCICCLLAACRRILPMLEEEAAS